ncbi:MAG: CdaR family protein [Tissierellia bacterium]|nr:CdaR family protein [Tissierellia bacterium]
MNFIKYNWKMKLLSLLSAVILWSFVMTNTNPLRVKQFKQVPVTIKNLDKLDSKGFTIIDQDEKPVVDLVAKAPRSKIYSLEISDVVASAELSDLKEGIQSLRVNVDSPNDVTIDKVTPKEINVKIEKIIEVQKPVELNISDELKKDKIIESTNINPESITIKGARSAVDKVDKLVCTVNDINIVNEGVSNIEINPIDKDGNIVEGVNLSQTFANVSISVSATKEVKINLNTKGKLNSNLKLIKKEVVPDKVLLKGEQQALLNVESVDTEAVDLSKIKANTQNTIGLQLPDGVVLNDPDKQIIYNIEVKKK